MPYKGIHVCVLPTSRDFDSYRIDSCGRKVDGKCVGHRYGLYQADGQTKSEVDELRFRVDNGWTAEAARAYCESQKGRFGKALEEQEPGGPERCVCPEDDCDYQVAKKRGVPCRSMTCPECGASLVAGDQVDALEATVLAEHPIASVAAQALELALAVVNDSGEFEEQGLGRGVVRVMLEELRRDLNNQISPLALSAVGPAVLRDLDSDSLTATYDRLRALWGDLGSNGANYPHVSRESLSAALLAARDEMERRKIAVEGFPVIEGGPGSGHHGHKGIPGQQGGSLPKNAISIPAWYRPPTLDDGLMDQLEDLGPWDASSAAEELEKGYEWRDFNKINDRWTKGSDQSAKDDIDYYLKHDPSIRTLTLYDAWSSDVKGKAMAGEPYQTFKGWLDEPQVLWRGGGRSYPFMSFAQSERVALDASKATYAWPLVASPRHWLGSGLTGAGEVYIDSEAIERIPAMSEGGLIAVEEFPLEGIGRDRGFTGEIVPIATELREDGRIATGCVTVKTPEGVDTRAITVEQFTAFAEANARQLGIDGRPFGVVRLRPGDGYIVGVLEVGRRVRSDRVEQIQKIINRLQERIDTVRSSSERFEEILQGFEDWVAWATYEDQRATDYWGAPLPQWSFGEGGPGSGNYGHRGIPGYRGGSLPKAAGFATPFTTAAVQGKIESESGLGGGICDSKVIQYEEDGAAVWKETTPSGYTGEFGHDGHSEVAAYRMNRLMGGDEVPQTVYAKDGKGRLGTSQAFVEGTVVGSDGVRVNEVANFDKDQMDRIVALDVIVGNGDRHGGNFLVKDGQPIAIDHGHAHWGKWEDGTWPMHKSSLVGAYIRGNRGDTDRVQFYDHQSHGKWSFSEANVSQWRNITRSEFDKAMAGVSQDRHVNLDNAWHNLQLICDRGELEW